MPICIKHNTIILYHGSPLIVRTPRIITPKRPMDYGNGFYCTTSKLLATQSAISKSFDLQAGYINIFELDNDCLNSLNVKTFHSANNEWVDFVEENRRNPRFEHNFDIVIGPVADDRVNQSFSLYEQRIISKQELIQRLQTYRLKNQYLFHTDKALETLKFIKAEHVQKKSEKKKSGIRL